MKDPYVKVTVEAGLEGRVATDSFEFPMDFDEDMENYKIGDEIFDAISGCIGYVCNSINIITPFKEDDKKDKEQEVIDSGETVE